MMMKVLQDLDGSGKGEMRREIGWLKTCGKGGAMYIYIAEAADLRLDGTFMENPWEGHCTYIFIGYLLSSHITHYADISVHER